MDAYLRRIGYEGPTEPSADTLRELHRHHLLSVPFENLDIGRRPINLDEMAFVQKIVEEGRGGFCYELNGAFTVLLRSLGFEVQLLSAGVARPGGAFGPDFDHLTLLVAVEGQRYLADVGFGDSFLLPLRLTAGIEQRDPAGSFRITRNRDAFVLQSRQEEWKPQYRFTLQPRMLEDYAGMCHYHQTSPETTFTQKKIVSRATPLGRITLTGEKLIITSGGKRKEKSINSAEQWNQALEEHFRIVLR